MALDPEILNEIKSYMEERTEAWKLNSEKSAQAAARDEVKAVDERVAKRNAIFGVGVGAILLSFLGFSYQSINSTVDGIAKEAGATAERIAKAEAESILATDQRVINFQKESMEAIVKAKTATSIALSDGRDARDEAKAALSEARNSLEDIETTRRIIAEQVEETKTQINELNALKSAIDNEVSLLKTTLSDAASQRESLVVRSENVERAVELSDRLLREGGQINDIVVAALGDEEVRQEIVSAAAFPKGAVVAFSDQAELSPVCPTGWSFYRQTQGRFLIGASDLYLPGETGGQAQTTLNLAQLPTHTHQIGRSDGRPLGFRVYPLGGDRQAQILHKDGPDFVDSFQALPTGEGKPVSNMPPYLALYYCKKD